MAQEVDWSRQKTKLMMQNEVYSYNKNKLMWQEKTFHINKSMFMLDERFFHVVKSILMLPKKYLASQKVISFYQTPSQKRKGKVTFGFKIIKKTVTKKSYWSIIDSKIAFRAIDTLL